jgi:primary-amine oxidase
VRGRRSSFVYLVALVVGLAGLGAVASASLTAKRVAAAPAAPLDPLTADELAEAKAIAEASSRFPDGGVFPTVTLDEPPKAEVNAWSPGQPFRREALLNVYDRPGNGLYEVVVDLRAHRVLSWLQRPGAEPPVFISEYNDLDGLIRADPRWRKAMRDRNIDPDDVYLDSGWAVGSLKVPGVKPGTRLLRALSFYNGDLPNPYDRPIEA